MKDKFSNFTLPGFWIFAFIIIILIITSSFLCHAEDSSYFPMNQNDNNFFNEDYNSLIDSQFDSDNNYIFVKYVSSGSSYRTYNCLYFPKDSNVMIYGEINNNGQQFSIYKYGADNVTYRAFRIYNNLELNLLGDAQLNNFNNFQNLYSSLYSSSAGFVSNFRLYSDNTENAEIVLKYGPDPNPPLDIGVAIVPPGAFVPDYPSGTTPPTQVPPTFTSSDYSWTTPPTFDSSSVTNAIGSIQNTLGWIANNLKEEFKNLTNNFKGFFKYIGDTIQYYGNAILETLNNFIQNFYDNMAALVQPIFEKISYITQPLDVDTISTAFNNNGLISVKNDFIDFFNDFDDIIRNTQEPETFDIIINIQNVRTFYNFGCRSPVVLHLGNNLNGTTKNIFRAFLWVLVVVGSIFLTEKNLSVWIKGGGFGVK